MQLWKRRLAALIPTKCSPNAPRAFPSAATVSCSCRISPANAVRFLIHLFAAVRDHLARAVFEGITAGLAGSVDLLRALGIDVAEVRLSSGGARSALWRGMCADMFDARVSLLASNASGASGVALLAAVGAGAFASVDAACAASITTHTATAPTPAHVKSYSAMKARATLAAKGALHAPVLA